MRKHTTRAPVREPQAVRCKGGQFGAQSVTDGLGERRQSQAVRPEATLIAVCNDNKAISRWTLDTRLLMV